MISWAERKLLQDSILGYIFEFIYKWCFKLSCDKTHAMLCIDGTNILKLNRNNILIDKANKNYKDISMCLEINMLNSRTTLLLIIFDKKRGEENATVPYWDSNLEKVNC